MTCNEFLLREKRLLYSVPASPSKGTTTTTMTHKKRTVVLPQSTVILLLRIEEEIQ
jgi:hypothetical protein